METYRPFPLLFIVYLFSLNVVQRPRWCKFVYALICPVRLLPAPCTWSMIHCVYTGAREWESSSFLWNPEEYYLIADRCGVICAACCSRHTFVGHWTWMFKATRRVSRFGLIWFGFTSLDSTAHMFNSVMADCLFVCVHCKITGRCRI